MAKVLTAAPNTHIGLQPSVLQLSSPNHLAAIQTSRRQEEKLNPPRISSREGSQRVFNQGREVSASLTVPAIRLTPSITGQGRTQSPIRTHRSLSESSISDIWPRTISPHRRLNPLEIECKILKAIEKHFSQVKQACQIIDVDKTSKVQSKDFRRIIETFCFPLTDEQFKLFAMKVPQTRGNLVDYKRFLDEIHPTMMQGDIGKCIASHFRRPDSRNEKFEEVENTLRTKITAQLPSVLKALRLFDYNRDGIIQRHDLKRTLENFCFRMTDAFFDRVWQKSDVPVHSNAVNYFDFLRRIGVDVMGKGYFPERDKRGSPSPVPIINGNQKFRADELQGLTISQVEKKFREAMINHYEDIKRTFVAFDKRLDGFITLEQLKRILTSFVFPLSDSLFAELMIRCGVKATHKISYDHFLEKFQHLGPKGNGQTITIKPSHKVNPIREADSVAQIDDVWRRLKNYVTDSFVSIKEAFLAFDDDKDGVIKRKDLRKVLDTFCIRISPDQVKEVMNRLDPVEKGYVTFHEFLDHFEAREGKGAHPWLDRDRKMKNSRHPGVMAWSMVEDILRDKLSDNWKTVSKAFTKVDDNQDGTISKGELRKLLNRYALSISDEHFLFLWDRCDENHDGKIEFGEFLRKLGVNMAGSDFKGFSTRITDESEAKITFMQSDQLQRLEQNSRVANARTSKMTSENVLSLLKEHISQRSADARKTFLKFDSDGDGKLSKKEFKMALENLGMTLTDDHFKDLVSRLDFYKGSLSYPDFLDAFTLPSKSNSGSTLHFSNHRYNKVIERHESIPAEEVEQMLKKKITEGFQDLRQAFHKVDEDHDGIISLDEFRRLLVNFMIPVDDANFTELLQRLRISANKPVNYNRFLQHFQPKEDIHKGHPWLFTENKFGNVLDMKEQTAEQAHMLLRTKAADQWYDISTAYRRFDRDGNGIVTKKELQAILNRFNIPVSKEEFKRLWYHYDTDHNNYIDHKEFLARLGVEFVPGDVKGLSTMITKGSEEEILRHHLSQKKKQQRATENQVNVGTLLTAMEVENRLRDLFRDSFPGFRKAFERVDTNQDGFISRAELLKVLHSYHLFMKDTELNILLNRIGLRNDDRLPYARFLAAFEDPRLSGNAKISIDLPSKAPPAVVFETAENLTNEELFQRIRNKVSTNARGMKQAFEAFDVNGTGRVPKEDLHRVINSFCCQISKKQLKALLDKLSIFPDGTIDYSGFLKNFLKSDTEVNRTWLDTMLKKDLDIKQSKIVRSSDSEEGQDLPDLSEMVKANRKSIEQSCKEHDPLDTGKIALSSLYYVLQEHGSDVTYSLLDQHLERLNMKDDIDMVTYVIFLKHCSCTGSSKNGRSRSPSPTPKRRKDTEPITSKKSPVLPAPVERTDLVQRHSLSPPETASDVEKRIYSKISHKWPKLNASFKRHDIEQSGLVNKKDFRDIFAQHDITLGDNEISLLWKKYDSNKEGRIKYGPFLKRFALTSRSLDEGVNSHQRSKLLSAQHNIKNHTALAILRRIQRDVIDNWKNMRRVFRIEDKKSQGSCSIVTFGQILRKFNIEVSEEDLFHLSSEFDSNLTGKILYNDFLRCFLV